MILYSQMEPHGTKFMMAFSLPLFAASLLVGLVANSAFDGAFFLVGLGIPLVWSFAYSKALSWFRSLTPTRPAWQFLAGATVVQSVAVALLVWAVA